MRVWPSIIPDTHISDTHTAMHIVKIATVILIAANSVFSFAGEVTNKLGITMVDIPAGSFMMGTSATGACNVTNDLGDCSFLQLEVREDEKPRHLRKIRKFQMGKTEVTLGQFRKFIFAAKRSDCCRRPKTEPLIEVVPIQN